MCCLEMDLHKKWIMIQLMQLLRKKKEVLRLILLMLNMKQQIGIMLMLTVPDTLILLKIWSEMLQEIVLKLFHHGCGQTCCDCCTSPRAE